MIYLLYKCNRLSVARKIQEEITWLLKLLSKHKIFLTKPGKAFKGEDWREKASVSRFVQANYTPYDGDESFLAGPTERSLHIKKSLKILKHTMKKLVSQWTLVHFNR